MWHKTMLFIALALFSYSTFANNNSHSRLHPHIDYIQATYLLVEDDSTDDGTIRGSAFNIELQKMLSQSIYANIGFQRYEDDDSTVELEDTYLNLGYVFYQKNNIAHAIQIGAARTNINILEFPIGSSVTRYGGGYRLFWHINHKWDFDGHLYYFDESENDFIFQDSYVGGDFRFNYYLSRSWALGFRLEVSENTNMAGATVRYVF
jgi:hypothetical protein